MSNNARYDVAVIGGGLAGLSCAILLAKQGYKVILFEKEKYPSHKVCGEYISLECYGLVQSLGVKLDDLKVPLIKKLFVSAPSGNSLDKELPLGGFGISRYKIDMELMKIAKQSGVEVFDGTRVNDVLRKQSEFEVVTDDQVFSVRAVCAAFGKRSNLDIKWKRAFTQDKPGPLNNYIGIKYHAKLKRADDLIELHNFKNGYCGISPIEDGMSCICYLTTADNLKRSNNNIRLMEQEVLCRNPHLSAMFAQAEILYEKPLTISQISFEKKRQFENGILFIGDAASMIAPLCGNGMSMALQGGRIAAACVDKYLCGDFSLEIMGKAYSTEWNSVFSPRLAAGRYIQAVFGSEWLTNLSISVLKRFPSLLTTIIRQTHG